MSSADANLNCLNCGNPENQVPLISIRFGGQPLWVCSQCMPVLIHEPQQLANKLRTSEEG